MNARTWGSSRSPASIPQRWVDAQEKAVVSAYLRHRRLLDLVAAAVRRVDALARLDLALALRSHGR
jgi:hypothetical protein